MEVCQRGTQTQRAELKHPSFFSFSFFELDESEALAEFLTENSSNNCWRGKDKKLVFCSLLIWNNMSCTVCCVCVCVCVTQGSSSLVLLTKDFKAPEERKVSVHLWTLAASRHTLYLASHLQSRNSCRFTSVISSHEKTVKSDFPVCCGLTSDGSWPCQICPSSFTVCASPSDSCLMSGSEDGQLVFTSRCNTCLQLLGAAPQPHPAACSYMLGLLAACRDIQVNINIRCYVRVWDTISITHIYKSRQYIFTCTVVLVLVIAWGACCSCALWRCPPPTLRYHPCSCGAREQLTPLSSPPSEYFSWGRGAGAECLCLESVWAFYLPPFFLFFFW